MPPEPVSVEVVEEPIGRLGEHAGISITFTVESVLEVEVRDGGLRGLLLREKLLAAPYTQDYDALPGSHPLDWARRFDVSQWGLLAARVRGVRVGGAVLAFATPGLQMLAGRDDLAVLWDLRVAPDHRGSGVGSALFAAAEAWAAARGCTRLNVETQNVNVRACRFYAGVGCELASIDRLAYPSLPGEVQLVWSKSLA